MGEGDVEVYEREEFEEEFEENGELTRRDWLKLAGSVMGSAAFFPIAHKYSKEGNSMRIFRSELSNANHSANGRYWFEEADIDDTYGADKVIAHAPAEAIGIDLDHDEQEDVVEALIEDKNGITVPYIAEKKSYLDELLDFMYSKHFGQYNTAIETPLSPGISEYEVRLEPETAEDEEPGRYATWSASGKEMLDWEQTQSERNHRLRNGAYDSHVQENLKIVDAVQE